MTNDVGTAFDAQTVRADFPILRRTVYDRPLVYLDNAATSQKPQAVIDAVSSYYEQTNSNVHRGVHRLSIDATDLYEGGREKLQRFIGAASPKEIIWTRGTTEAINLVAQTYGRANVHEGDEVVITWLEHHSNIVPWQMLCEERGAKLNVVPINDAGELDMDAYAAFLNERTWCPQHVSPGCTASQPPLKYACPTGASCGRPTSSVLRMIFTMGFVFEYASATALCLPAKCRHAMSVNTAPYMLAGCASMRRRVVFQRCR